LREAGFTEPISIYTNDPSTRPDDVKVDLIQKGYRAGLFGWTVARYLGDIKERGIDVTPESSQKWDGSTSDAASTVSADTSSTLTTASFSQRQRSKIHAELEKIEPSLPHKRRLSTFLVRIPVRSGDGYFRFRIRTQNGKHTVYTPTVRILSVSLSSASIKGSSILPPTVVPELVIRALGVALTTFLYGLFPIAAILEKVLPRKWSRKLLGWLYRKLGMEERQRKFMDKHGQGVVQAKRKAMETVPFASMGMRTKLELEKDEKVGRGGVIFAHAS